METTDEEYLIYIEEPSDNAEVVYLVKHLTARIGFDEARQALVASAASELSTNIIRYAGNGRIIIHPLSENGKIGIQITAEDKGPGIPDIELAFTDHYTTGKSLGLGLPSIKRIMDDVKVESVVDKGTIISMTKWR